MNILKLFFVFIVAMSLVSCSTAAPAKIPIKAIKTVGKAVGKGLRAINIASTANDVFNFLKPKKRKH
ncbi:moricin-2 [Bombyx mandarina]|uniref:Moricin-2 n=2 Tax=Bombyx TaxID=7090 RepID=MOR2_BOMMO|nr:moricin-2 precursor [Bombyx mori]XP_028033655.1 moricin-2 [Bombyx mandarina]O96059.1 RecName: Full=Moricin-2; Flags: Precursor [Bombyx mori]BAA34260.1 moricin2 [Bombyx mori]BAA77338.1 moricin 2 [Bombyx mori]